MPELPAEAADSRLVPSASAHHDERYPLDEVVYTDPSDGGLLQVVHDMDELAKQTPAEEWKQTLRAERSAQERVALRLGGLGQEGVGAAGDRQRATSSPCTRATPTSSGPSATAARSASSDLWIKLCGNSHTGSFKDLGMTVLVSHGQADDRARGERDPRGGLCVHRRHLGGPGRLRGGRRDPRRSSSCPADKISMAQLIQPVANGAIVFALDTDFDGCMKIVKPGVRARRHLPRQLDEQPAHRGTEDGRDRDRPAVRLGGARVVGDPGRKPRATCRRSPRGST